MTIKLFMSNSLAYKYKYWEHELLSKKFIMCIKGIIYGSSATTEMWYLVHTTGVKSSVTMHPALHLSVWR